MSVTITAITSIEECRIIERLQAEIWESSELEVAPDHLLWTIVKEGGMVLLARNETGEPIGFAYGFLGWTATKYLKLASHQVGVLSAYQNEGIGYQIKLAQREIALAQGLDLITWTFDPLQGRNANLNLRKLGVVCNTYLPNLYGLMRDELNQGLPSDRFRVEWWLDSVRVEQRLAGEVSSAEWDYPIINAATQTAEGLFSPPEQVTLPQEDYALVEIPTDINQLREVAPALALRWRLHTRQIFQTAFEAGYTVVDLLRRDQRNYYLLQKNWQRT
jgi:predicted GNAT superfamily acetyltransferase